MGRAEILLERVRSELGDVHLVSRSLLPRILRIFLNRPRFANFATTIGRTIYVPDSWASWTDDARYRLLRHEIMHVRRFCRWPTRWSVLNTVIIGILYFTALPFLWTWRARFEREGYAQTMLVHFEDGVFGDLASWDRVMLDHFASSEYLWMDTKKGTLDWVASTYVSIVDGRLSNRVDRVPSSLPESPRAA